MRKSAEKINDAAVVGEKADSSQDAAKELTIEESLEQLQQILTEMEKEELPLEESFAHYERGVKLIREVNARIDRVEKKVQMLTEDGVLEEYE